MSLNSIEKLKLMGSTSVENNAVSQTSNLNAESIFNNSNVINSQSGMFESSAYLEKNATNVFDSSKKTTQNYQEDQDPDTLSLRQELEQTKKDQGIVSKAWDGIKNFFGAKNSSSNVEKTIEKFENGEISEEEARQALDEYKNAQSTFTEKLSGIISTAGLIGTVAGAVLSLIPGGQVIGLPLLAISGKVALGGMFVDNALDLVDNSTDKDGLTKDELKDLAIETGVEAVAYVAGRGIGKLTGNMHTNISNKLIANGTNKVASKAIGYAGEALADGALSLSADYGIAQTQSLITTGKTVAWKDYWSWDRFKSEGRSQLIGILTGVATSKQYSSGTIAPSATGAKVASDGADVVSTKGVDGDVAITAPAETKTGELMFNPETGELRRVKSSNKTKAEKLSQAEAGCNVGVELRPETTGAKVASDGVDVVSTKGVDGDEQHKIRLGSESYELLEVTEAQAEIILNKIAECGQNVDSVQGKRINLENGDFLVYRTNKDGNFEVKITRRNDNNKKTITTTTFDTDLNKTRVIIEDLTKALSEITTENYKGGELDTKIREYSEGSYRVVEESKGEEYKREYKIADETIYIEESSIDGKKYKNFQSGIEIEEGANGTRTTKIDLKDPIKENIIDHVKPFGNINDKGTIYGGHYLESYENLKTKEKTTLNLMEFNKKGKPINSTSVEAQISHNAGNGEITLKYSNLKGEPCELILKPKILDNGAVEYVQTVKENGTNITESASKTVVSEEEYEEMFKQINNIENMYSCDGAQNGVKQVFFYTNGKKNKPIYWIYGSGGISIYPIAYESLPMDVQNHFNDIMKER